jgi:hypothetical protein
MRELEPSDDSLLLSGEPEDFGRFYDRYVRSLLAYFRGARGIPRSPPT